MTFENVAANLRESFRIIARSHSAGEISELRGVSIASAGVTFQMFNSAFLSEPVAGDADLERRVLLAYTYFGTRGLDWAYWVCEGWLDSRAQRRARRVFERCRLRHSVDLPGMVCERLAPPAVKLPQLDVRRVSQGPEGDAFCAIGSLCFNVPLGWFREVFESGSVWDAFASYVGYQDGEPVSTTAVVIGGGALGVYNVATIPGHRRRGYGEAVMRQALEDVRQRHGIERVILQSTPAGLELYQRMGFRTVTKVSVYSS